MWPNTALLPKVLGRSHLNQPIRLVQCDPSLGGGEVKTVVLGAGPWSVEATTCIRRSEQLFVKLVLRRAVLFRNSACPTGSWSFPIQAGRTTILDRGHFLYMQGEGPFLIVVISYTCRAKDHSLPSRVKCYSTRSVSPSWGDPETGSLGRHMCDGLILQIP